MILTAKSNLKVKFYSFSSEIEFLNVVDRLDNELCYGEDVNKYINNR